MTELAIFGAGGHGIVVAEAAKLQGRWSSIVLYDDAPTAVRDTVGFSVLGNLAALLARLQARDLPELEVAVAIGHNQRRWELYESLALMGAAQAIVIHPAAVVSPSCRIAAGTVLLARAVVGARAFVGRACIINVGAIVDHDCRIEDAVHVAPGAVLAGGVRVGKGSWIGTGACLLPGVNVAENSIVPGGATLVAPSS